MDILKSLNPQQHEAVTSTADQILVLAGPGSGKTRVLTQRIAYLIYEQKVKPENILAVTFTNKAAKEIRGRLERMLGKGVAALWLGTFHSICARILRIESYVLPFDANYVIMDSDDQKSIVKRILKEMNLDDKLYPPNALHAIISNAKNQLTSSDNFKASNYREEIAKRVYERYETTLRNSNAVDFDDLLLWTVKLFEDHPEIRKKYAQRFSHVLIDEFQDTNQAQYELIKYLSSFHHTLFAVGDEDQSIYRWRGADYRNVIRFEKEHPRALKLLLERNYRSTQNILDTAQAVIKLNSARTHKNLFSKRGCGNPIVLYEAVDEHAEAAYVVDDIMDRIAAGDDGGSCAVMYRTNAQSRLFEEAFLRTGLPYRLVGAQRFYGRREIKDLVAFLRLVHNPNDTISLNRTINLPPRGIGSKTLEMLDSIADENACYTCEIILSLGKDGEASPYWSSFNARNASALTAFGALLVNWQKLNNSRPLPDLFDQIIKDIDYRGFIDDGTDSGQARWENVLELRQLAFEFESRGMNEFLETIALVSDQDTIPEALNVPTLLTLHAAKGLEFSTVYIVGLDEGLLPHNRSFDDPEEMDEERRLFYVGITRAKNNLALVRSSQRSNFGRFEYTMPSRFLDDIPNELIKQEGVRLGVRCIKPLSQPRWVPTSLGKTKKDALQNNTQHKLKYKAGMHVIHPTWGDGMVIETRVMGSDETVSVMFETVGLKRLAASLANLEIVT